MLLDEIYNNTKLYIENVSKDKRKEIGQFFTDIDTARYMAETIKPVDDSIRVLDPGCGTGILAAAVVEKLSNLEYHGKITIDLYENNSSIFNLLNHNIVLIKDFCLQESISLEIHLKKENFITSNKDVWQKKRDTQRYDYVICNPPYKKIGRSTIEAITMQNIIHGQPNIYFLFMAMSTKLTKKNGTLVFITPRSWVSGAYFNAFRDYFLSKVSLNMITLFSSREEVFNTEPILQETMIINCSKSTKQNTDVDIVTVQTAQTYAGRNVVSIKASECIGLTHKKYVVIPTNNNEYEALKKLSHYTNTILSLGYKLKTGPVVEFRQPNKLHKNKVSNSIYLLQSCNLVDGKIKKIRNSKKLHYYVPGDKDANVLVTENMLLIKRLTSKEESRRLQVSVLDAKLFPHKEFTIENHVNYLIGVNSPLSKYELYGLYVLLSSEVYDNYYRALNGSTQVNANEINNMPMPSKDRIIELGQEYLQGK